LFNATLNKDLKQFPTTGHPGKLAISLIPDTIGHFGILPRKNKPYNAPITYKYLD
jgi:hypothetical protein